MNRSTDTSNRMLARDSGAPATSGGVSVRSPVTADMDPDMLVEKILSLLSQERFKTARRLAAEAAELFPDHPRLQTAMRVFDKRGAASRRPGNEPKRTEEFAWLSNPPDSARGKWVALLGNDLVAMSEDLTQLMDLLRSKKLPKPALVHYVDR